MARAEDVERNLAEILVTDFVEGRTPAIKAALFVHATNAVV